MDLATRTIASSSKLSAKAGSSKNSPSKANNTMGQRPSDVPDSISSPNESKRGSPLDGFEPIVNDMRSTEGPHSVNSSTGVEPDSKTIRTGATAAASDLPLSDSTPSSTESSQIPQEPYQIPDQPDLTKLPSLDFGLEEPAKVSPKIDAPAGSEETAGARTGAKAKPSLSSIEQRRRNFTRFMLLSGLVGSGIGAYYLATKDDEAMSAEEQALGAWERFKNNFTGLLDVSRIAHERFQACSADDFDRFTQTFNKPAFDKLLPDPLPAPHQRPYTLLIDLEDMLVHSAWDVSITAS